MTHEQKIELLKSRHAIAFEKLHGYKMELTVKPRTLPDNLAVVMMDSDNGHRTVFASIAECSMITGKPKNIIYKILKKRLKNVARFRFSYA
jgi:sugar/nucleoside kinase (ribokinase family)